MGIARTFQNIRLFRDLTVLDNVLIGLHNETKYSACNGDVPPAAVLDASERIAKERALELLSIFDMQDLADHQGWLVFRTARREDWRSFVRWRPIRACCCSTSPLPV